MVQAGFHPLCDGLGGGRSWWGWARETPVVLRESEEWGLELERSVGCNLSSGVDFGARDRLVPLRGGSSS